MFVLAADLGGSTARLAVYEVVGQTTAPVHNAITPASNFGGVGEVLDSVPPPLRRKVTAACLAVAGPVVGLRAHLTNLPWEVETRRVAEQLGLPLNRVALINDVEAVAWAIPYLDHTSLCTLRTGISSRGNVALLAVGTGLGQAGLVWDGQRLVAFAGEGGHADFAPRDALEWALVQELSARHGHASWERVLSGPGLVTLYQFLLATSRSTPPAAIAERLNAGQGAAVVVEAAEQGLCPMADQTIRRWVALLGAEAGNLALKMKATGGVFLGGGIPPKLLNYLKASQFIAAFLAKGRMRGLLEHFPVNVILDEAAGLKGAAQIAIRLANSRDRG